MIPSQSDVIARINPGRGSVIVKAIAALTPQDWGRLAEPGTKPYLKITLILWTVADCRRGRSRPLRAVVYADRPLTLVAPAEEGAKLGESAFPIYNLQDLKAFLLRAWRKLAGK